MMNKIPALFLILIGQPAFGQSLPPATASTDSLSKFVYFLASDSLKGRGTGTKEQEIAAGYIADRFKANHLLSPKGFKRPYMQEFSLINVPMIKGAKFKIDSSNQVIYNYNDFILASSVGLRGGIYTPFMGNIPNLTCQANAIEVISSNTLKQGLVMADSIIRRCNHPANVMICLPSKLAVELTRKRFALASMLKVSTDSSGDTLFTSSYGQPIKAKENPYYTDILPFTKQHAGSSIFFTDQFLLKKLFTAQEIDRYQSSAKPVVGSRIVVDGSTSPDSIRTINTENVLGYLEGTDKKNEVVIVSGHYDHIGTNKSLSIGASNAADTIFNGADDNASGTAAVMEVARLFSEASQKGFKPRRSILFVAFTGEELGLIGSSYMAENPLFPLTKTKSIVNLDMVGRSNNQHTDKDMYVYTLALERQDDFYRIQTFAAQKAKIDLPKDISENERSLWTYGSDHQSFVQHKVPALIVTTGEHPDYHTAADEASKINYKRLARIANFTFYTVWQIANE